MYLQTHRAAIIALILATSSACVSVHTGEPTSVSSTALRVSCSYGQDLHSQSLSGIVCNLENTGKDWADVKVKSVRAPDQSDVSLVSAADLKILAEAQTRADQRQQYNGNMALTGLILTGALVAIGGGDSATRSAGELAMVGGGAAVVGRDINKTYQANQYGPAVYGEGHLLGGSLRVPPDLSIQRQVVIQHPSAKPKLLEICWEGVPDCSRVKL